MLIDFLFDTDSFAHCCSCCFLFKPHVFPFLIIIMFYLKIEDDFQSSILAKLRNFNVRIIHVFSYALCQKHVML